VITAGPWPSIPASWSLLIERASETSACCEPSRLLGRDRRRLHPGDLADQRAPIRRGDRRHPGKTAPRASDCSAEARSSRYSATLQPPPVIRPLPDPGARSLPESREGIRHVRRTGLWSADLSYATARPGRERRIQRPVRWSRTSGS
jgi:hypothetical protein